MIWLWTAFALAGAWTQEPGGGYAKLGVRWQAALGPFDDYHDALGEVHHMGDYQELSAVGYGEVGVAEGLTLLGGWAPVAGYGWSAGVNRYAHVGTSDPMVGARVGLIRRSFVLSLQPTLTAPLADGQLRRPFVDAQTGRPLGELRVGAGVWDVGLRAQLGYSWRSAWLGGELGGSWRSGGYRDTASAQLELGGHLSERWLGLVRLLYLAPVGGTTAPLDNSPSGIGNGARYPGFAGEVSRSVSDLLSVGFIEEGSFFYARQGGGPVSRLYMAAGW